MCGVIVVQRERKGERKREEEHEREGDSECTIIFVCWFTYQMFILVRSEPG